MQQLSECNFKMITCSFISNSFSNHFQFHNKILNSSKLSFISKLQFADNNHLKNPFVFCWKYLQEGKRKEISLLH